MMFEVFAAIFLCNMLLLTQPTTCTENKENVTIIGESSVNYTSKAVITDKPVVMHTQLQYYEQPTLKEYQECHENLVKCKKVCEGAKNQPECIKECPVCPYLIKEEVVVQGVNDTDFSPPAVTPLNTTNIIRLTNQIRNIIESYQGSIVNRNENNVHVHQNASRVGGKFGLGYNNTEPCCIIVRSSKNCEIKPLSTANRCHHKRHRVCGKQCKARVMIAKRTILCEKPSSHLSGEDYTEERCHESVKYVPHQSRRKQYSGSTNKCSFSPFWPYVSCDENGANNENSICRRCLDLPYYYILQRGIPPQCRKCFMTYANPNAEIYPLSWYPVARRNIKDSDYFDSNLDGWHQDKTKCRLPNGSIAENCQGNVDTDIPFPSSDPYENLPEAQDEYFEYNKENEMLYDHFEKPRTRRQTFTRSKYSRRYI